MIIKERLAKNVLLSSILLAVVTLVVASVCKDPELLMHRVLLSLPYVLLFFIALFLFNRYPEITLSSIVSGIEIYGLVSACKGLLSLHFPIRIPSANIICGFFENSGPFGGLMAIALCVSFVHLWQDRHLLRATASAGGKTNRIVITTRYLIAMITACLCSIALLLSLSRAAWLSVFVSFFAFIVIERKSLSDRARKISLALFLVFLAILILSFYLKRESAIGRIHIWWIECLVILRNPLGCGIGYELGCFGETQASMATTSVCPEYAFNEYLKFGMQGGILCLLAVVVSTIVAIVLVLNKNKEAGCGFIALAVFAFASYPLSLSVFRIIAVIFFAIALSGPSERNKQPVLFTLLIMTAILTTATVGYRKGVSTAQKAFRGLRYSNSDWYYPSASSALTALYDEMRFDYDYLYEYGYALYKDRHYVEAVEVLQKGSKLSADPMFHNTMGLSYQKLKQYDKALAEYQYAHRMLPCRIMPLYLELLLYEEINEQNKAHDMAVLIDKMPINPKNKDMIQLQAMARQHLKHYMIIK